jgi:predicted phage baseplate assembly protein
MTRPLGVKDVTNPVAAEGGDDPESRDEARRNAPLTVMTLDRVVSLQDYEDFARAFSGIGKALASWAWDGRRQSVYVTVAGVQGADVSQDSLLYHHLVDAIHRAGDPSIPVAVGSYRPVFFKVRANIKVHPDYQADRVVAESRTTLRTWFSFDARELGQPVALSEVIAVLQHVEGVLAVDVDQFYRATGTPGFEPPERLVAALPVEGAMAPAPAELLLLHPQPTDIQVMK